MADEENPVLVERRGTVQYITINRVQRRNALNPDVMARIGAGVREAVADPSARAIVLTGAGEKAFCAGADLAVGTSTFLHDYASPTMPLADLMREVRAAPLPVIARVNGACVAGGMGLLAMCDMAVASDNAIFGLPEVKIGMFPFQVLAVLGELLAPRHLNELCMTGEPISAVEAKAIGLINHVVPLAELDAKTDWLVSRLVDKSPTALRRGKYVMRAMEGMTFPQRMAFTESQVALSASTEDAKEGVASFNEKRPPVWTGR